MKQQNNSKHLVPSETNSGENRLHLDVAYIPDLNLKNGKEKWKREMEKSVRRIYRNVSKKI